jgi:hypothetical protein
MWLGYLQPEGLVVSPAALVDSQVFLSRTSTSLQQEFLQWIDLPQDGEPHISDFETFAEAFLGWTNEVLVPAEDELTFYDPNWGEELRPTHAFKDPSPKDPEKPYVLLIQQAPPQTNLDKATTGDEASWTATPTQRFIRLLTGLEIPLGLMVTGTDLRLVYAPKGESPGWLTFPVKAMSEIPGRPIVEAFHLLLERYRLVGGPPEARLPALLHRSRLYQSGVSSKLAGQVLDALYELLRGFQSADQRVQGRLLQNALANDPNGIYHGLLTVLMRLVFLLYAEDRGVMPNTELYNQFFSAHGLHEKLREDHERYPDTMADRFGAWAQLLTLFRAVYAGCVHPELKMPPRHGYLFDPARFPFLDGQTIEGEIPLVPDGTVYAVLNKLLVLGGERLSYRTLDVEQIGSVYEAMMGFKLLVTEGQSIAIKPAKKSGAPTIVNLEELVGVKSSDRAKWLKEHTDQEISGKAAPLMPMARTIDDLLVAMDGKIARNATPHPVPAGSLTLQPSAERRRTGSHYTPRSLTAPIVAKTLEPILARLKEEGGPTPAQILELKVADIAMGSGAFLVEACRQLADRLVEAWARHGGKPDIPPDEDELLFAKRLVAQRCLYGVDKNPMATELAKLSLWLATLAKDHPFTFLDHSLRSGDSLVGLSVEQIKDFHWEEKPGRVFGQEHIEKLIEQATSLRQVIRESASPDTDDEKVIHARMADDALERLRFVGDLVIAAFFGGDKPKSREEYRDTLLDAAAGYLEALPTGPGPSVALLQARLNLRGGMQMVTPFHWDIEFPEVFARRTAGFDAIVGNPPFMAGPRLTAEAGVSYRDWLLFQHQDSHGNADIVSHFYRRAYNGLRVSGSFGLIATNTIAQGDTRVTGLTWICTHGGCIFAARRRHKWPGVAAVVVSVVFVSRSELPGPFDLDGRTVDRITAFLFHQGSNDDPLPLQENTGMAFKGSDVYGMGFTFDDSDESGVASSLAVMRDLIQGDPRCHQFIFPFTGGEELNDSAVIEPHRYIVGLGQMTEVEAQQFPTLYRHLLEKVKPYRMAIPDSASNRSRRDRWWQWSRPTEDLYRALEPLEFAFACSQVTARLGFVRVRPTWAFSHGVVVFATAQYSVFAALQSSNHELWARFFGSSLEDRLRYTPSDCFDTFPFPKNWETDPTLETVGNAYYEFRADLMIRHDEGLTKTYNRFHDPNETNPDILRLREQHEAMDRAVLDAYGWTDVPTHCEFLLDYEEVDEDGEFGGSDLFDGMLPKKRGKGKKKPWRYRWPDEIRDEVLARLLALNAERAAEEKRLGLTSGKRKAAKASHSTHPQLEMEETDNV